MLKWLRKVLCNITKVIIIINKSTKKAENYVDKTIQYGNTLNEGANYLERKSFKSDYLILKEFDTAFMLNGHCNPLPTNTLNYLKFQSGQSKSMGECIRSWQAIYTEKLFHLDL